MAVLGKRNIKISPEKLRSDEKMKTNYDQLLELISAKIIDTQKMIWSQMSALFRNQGYVEKDNNW